MSNTSFSSSIKRDQAVQLYKTRPKYNKLGPIKHSSSSKFISTKNAYGDDIENISQEMSLINKEIKIKIKEYEKIKKNYDKIEEENAVVIGLLENLITECQEIDDPLEKRAKDVGKEGYKMQLFKDLVEEYDKEYGVKGD